MTISSDLLSHTFENVKQVTTDVWRAEKCYRGKPFEIHYFDASESALSTEFDIDSYQYELLGEDFYSRTAEEQSSFYLNLIFSQEEKYSLEQSGNLRSTLENKSFARKLLISNEDIEELGSEAPEFSSGMSKNPVDVWTSILEPIGLEFVMSQVRSRDSTVELILKGTRDIETTARNTLEEYVKPIDGIESLYIRQYRPKLQNKRFAFGKVNLIKGSNATGKTSLLEAIELLICGKTLRNQDKEELFSYEASFQGGNEAEQLTNLAPNEYRSRDRHWYGRHYRSGNKLAQSFSRFNFFDTDAAIRFSSDFAEGEILRAFEGVVFGSEPQNLERHLKGICTELDRQCSRMSSKKSELDSMAARIRRNSSGTESQESTLPNTDKLSIDELRRLGIDSDEDMRIEALQSKLRELEVEVSYLFQTEPIPSSTKITQLPSLLERTKRIQDDVERSEDLTRNARSRELETQSKIAAEQPLLEKFKYLASYTPPLLEELRSLASKLKTDRDTLNKAHSFISGIRNIFGKNFPLGTSNPAQKKIDLGKEIDTLRTEISRLEDSYSVAQSDHNETTKSLMHVKNEALQVARKEKLDHCPACNTFHGSDALIASIENSLDVVTSSSDSRLKQLSLEISERQDSIRSKTILFNDYSKLVLLLESLKFDTRISLDRLAEAVDTAENLTTRLKFQIEESEKRNREIELQGFTLAAYDNACRSIGNPDLMHGQIQEHLEALLKGHELNLKVQQECLDLLARERETRKDLFKGANWSKDHIEDLSQLSLFRDRLNKLTDCTQTLASFFKVSSDMSVADLRTKVSETEKSLASLLETRERTLLLSKEAADLIRIESQIDSINTSLANGEEPLKALTELIENHSLQKMLSEFLGKNVRVIEDIFLNIHSPKEFENLNVENGELVLTRKSGQQASVTTLSTGQRSALSLSLFLTLNLSLEHGPNLVILDDPIAYTDDLNILTFLDFLRDLSLNCNRQIFFATASDRLAGLFERKFEFLESDFTSRFISEH
jgi:DNA repair exonuclease SbcCD ATPase subunit